MTTVHEQLDTLRTSLGACRLVAFIDLESELVLSSSAARKPPQEELDILASKAALALPMANQLVTGQFPEDTPHDEALILTQYDTTMYLRCSDEAAEALCCVCAGTQDVQALREGAKSVLMRIAEAG